MKIVTVNKVVCYLKTSSDIKKTSRKITETKKEICNKHLQKFYNNLPSVKSKQKPINDKFFAHCKKYKDCL